MNARLFVLLITALFSNTAFTQSFPSLLEKADSLYRLKLFLESAHCYERALGSINEKFVRATDFYNCACSFSLARQDFKAFYYLEKAIKKGGIYSKDFEKDKDFIYSKDSKKWHEMIRLAVNMEKALDIPLVEKLQDLIKKDQVFRKKIDSLFSGKISNDSLMKIYSKNQSKIDSINLIAAKEILDKRGYPRLVEVGKLSDVLFMVIQHSDLENMELYLPMFIKAADNGDLNWQALVLMIDRVKKKKGQKQIYGTQFVRDSNRKWRLYDVEDADNLNSRRLKIGLGTIEEETKFWNNR